MTPLVVTGPAITAVSGISTHLRQLFASPLSSQYRFVHFEAGSRHGEGFGARVGRLIAGPFLFARCLLASGADIVHFNSPMDFKGYWRDIVYFLIAKLSRKKIIFQLHGGDQPERFFRNHGISSRFRKWQLGAADAVVLLSERERRAAQDYCLYKRLAVIPNAIDVKEFADFPPRAFPKDRYNLVYIGRLIREKGIFEAIEALAILRREGMDNLSLSVAGSGPAEAELRERVEALGLQGQVAFLGTVLGAEKVQFWRNADLCLFATHFPEGLPYTILESLAVGVPVITTRVGAIPEAVEDGVHGVFVEPRDPDALARAIRAMLSNPDRLNAMSMASVIRGRDHFGIERLASEFGELYRSLDAGH
jgi:glycosyltransferase involved in cell wall biosynthesis